MDFILALQSLCIWFLHYFCLIQYINMATTVWLFIFVFFHQPQWIAKICAVFLDLIQTANLFYDIPYYMKTYRDTATSSEFYLVDFSCIFFLFFAKCLELSLWKYSTIYGSIFSARLTEFLFRLYYVPHCSFWIVRWLKEQKKLNIFVEPRVKSELLTESSFYNFVETWKDGKLGDFFIVQSLS